MKKLTLLVLVLTLTLIGTAQQNFEVMTKKPPAGSTITIEYMPRNTVLQGVKGFEATAYLLEGSLPVAKEVALKQEGGIYRGTVKTNDTTKAVFFSFAKDEVRDNNNDEGYYTALYDKSGTELMGSNAALGAAFANFGGIWRLKRNTEKAAGFYKTEFLNPAAKTKLPNDYFTYLVQSKNEADKELLKSELAKEMEKANLGEADLLRVKSSYEFALKDKEKAAVVMAKIKERFPNGSWNRNQASAEFYQTKSLEEKEKLYRKYITTYGPFSKEDEMINGSMAATIARMNADSGNYEAAKKYLAEVKRNDAKANSLNSIAWKLSGEGVNNKPLDVKTGLELSMQSLKFINEEKKSLAGKPPYYTTKQYIDNLNSSYYTFADTYATLLYHNGDFDKAFAIEKEAVDHFKGKDVSMNEAFTMLTEKTKGPKAAQAELEKFFAEGKYTPAMKEQLKTIYLAANTNNQEGWTKYVTNLEEMAYSKLKADLAKQMINLPAPQFALKDMSGKQVALSSLKGKIVVVDFWATWCGPCIASFPGMQKAVNKFKAKDDVVFLFIDTWENDSNRTQKVTDFIAKNKYSFNVLYDDPKSKEGNDFVVVQDFKVEGIPTKFVIDRNSNIRFKTVGYSGSADAIVSELSAMIDMVGADNSAGAKKAF